MPYFSEFPIETDYPSCSINDEYPSAVDSSVAFNSERVFRNSTMFLQDDLMAFRIHNIGGCLLSHQHISRNLLLEFPSPDENFLSTVEIVQKFFSRVLESTKKDRDRNLPTPVDPNMEEIFLIKFEVNPRPTIGNDPGVIEDFTAAMGLDLVLIEEAPGERCS
jgi:hypothetical protein